MAVWSRPGSRIEKLFDTYRGWWAGLVAWLALIFGIGFFLFTSFPFSAGLAPIPTSGPAASWTTLYRFASEQAKHIDKTAVLEAVLGSPVYNAPKPYTPQSTPLDVDFDFVRPSGASIRIEVLDVDPPRLLRVVNPWDYAEPPYTGDVLSQFSSWASYIKLSPREAYALTEAKGEEYAQSIRTPVEPEVDMFLDHDWSKKFGVPAGWYVDYMGGDFNGPHTLYLSIDGATGKILAEERYPEDERVTPTVSPTGAPTRTP